MKKPFLFALGLVAVAVAACGGKVVVESSGASGTGGSGGTSTTLTTGDGAPDTSAVGVTSVAVAVAVAASVTTGTGTSACDPTYTCAEAITPPAGDPTKLCDNTLGAKLYDALVQCTCVDTCQIECAGSVCVSSTASATCAACLQDPVNGCGDQFNACANDI